MTDFVVRPIAPHITAHVRTTLLAPEYGHPVHRELARGTGPCRECLGTFSVGEEDRLLFTHNPYGGSSRLAQPGPVFIHAEPCRPHAGGGYPEGLRRVPVLAEAHLEDGSTSSPRPLSVGNESDVLRSLLDSPAVSFVHLRHATAGCFIARVERQEHPRAGGV